MKKNKLPYYPQTFFISTDGSTIQTNFIYSKEDFFINPDLKSNHIWISQDDSINSKELNKKLIKLKDYDFNFKGLI